MPSELRATVVHEAEAQRQYPRVRIPATLSLAPFDRDRGYKLIDLSLGGFAFDTQGDEFQVDSEHTGTLQFAVQPLGLSIELSFRVLRVAPDAGRASCKFQELGRVKAAMLRQLIAAHLSGELISVGEVLTTLTRDNYTAPRGQKGRGPGQGLSGLARARALALTCLMFIAGLVACVYAASRLYNVVFVTRARSAKVAAPSFEITMPREGAFFSLVPADGKVKKGQPLGTFRTTVLDLVEGHATGLRLTREQISTWMGEPVQGTLSSPCDCIVRHQYVLEGQYVQRNQPLMELLPEGTKPYVLARFAFEHIAQLTVGKTIGFRLSGEPRSRTGRVRELRMPAEQGQASFVGTATDVRGISMSSATQDLLVEIEPSQPLDIALVEQPVEVSVGALSIGFQGFPLVVSASGGGR